MGFFLWRRDVREVLSNTVWGLRVGAKYSEPVHTVQPSDVGKVVKSAQGQNTNRL